MNIIKIILGITAFISFFLLLGLAGASDNNTMSFSNIVTYGSIFISIFGLSVIGINKIKTYQKRKEQTKQRQIKITMKKEQKRIEQWRKYFIN